MGKGDKRRPRQISEEEMRRRWEKAFGRDSGSTGSPARESGPRCNSERVHD